MTTTALTLTLASRAQNSSPRRGGGRARSLLAVVLLCTPTPLLTGCETMNALGEAAAMTVYHAALSQIDGEWADVAGTIEMSHAVDVVNAKRKSVKNTVAKGLREALWDRASGKIVSKGDTVRITLKFSRGDKDLGERSGTLVKDPKTNLYTTIKWDKGGVTGVWVKNT